MFWLVFFTSILIQPARKVNFPPDSWSYHFLKLIAALYFVTAKSSFEILVHLLDITCCSFIRLFQYIQGANLNYSRIAVTVPVVTSIVPGAGPFRSSAYVVRFYLPVKLQADPPVPLDELHLKPYAWNSHCVAVRKFSGYAKDENIAEEAKRLADSLSRSPWANLSSTESNYSYSIAQYDSPFQFIGRTNEVWADIKVSGADGCNSSAIASY